MPDTVVTINVGHPPAVLFGLNHLIRIRRDQLAFYEELRAKYGDVVRLRLGPHRSWILFHPEQIEALLTRQWASFIRFKRLTEVVAQWNGDSLLLAEGDEWRERRRKVLPAFQSRRMPGYGDKAVAHAARLGAELARRARATGSVTIDTDAVMARLTLDIAAGTIFGDEPPENGDEIENALQVLSDVAFRESTSPFTLPDWLPLASKRRKTEAMEVMDRLVTGLVTQGLARGADDCGDLLSMLIEQHAGALPSWLAPVQVGVLNITDAQADYCREIAKTLADQGLRVDLDLRNEKITYKIREHSLRKLPYLLVVGDKEKDSGCVAVRARGNKDLGVMSLQAFSAQIAADIANKS
jgi:hypothetical protein